MNTTQFTLSVGAKRQVTIPQELMTRLSLEKGSQILLQISVERVELIPMASVPQATLSRAQRAEILARRGVKDSDLTVAQFLAGSSQQGSTRKRTASKRARKG